MEGINPKEIALVGTTYQPKWYAGPTKSIKHTDKIRGDLILYSIQFAAGVGYKVVIVDGGSAKTFISQIKKIPGVKLFLVKTHKRSPNKRKAIFEASKIPEVQAIVLTEIEKVSLITDGMQQITYPVIHEGFDIVVPKREDSLFKKSYPDYMYASEVEGNLLYNEALRANGLLSAHEESLDVFFGARVFKNDPKFLKSILSKYASNPFDTLSNNNIFDIEEYSSAQFFPIVEALSKGKKVKSVTVPFLYPEKQKQNEEIGQKESFIMKRNFQRTTILVELMHFLGFLNHKKGRRITKE